MFLPVIKGHTETSARQRRLLDDYTNIQTQIHGQGLTLRIQNERLARIEAKLDRLLDDRQPDTEQGLEPQPHQPRRWFHPQALRASLLKGWRKRGEDPRL